MCRCIAYRTLEPTLLVKKFLAGSLRKACDVTAAVGNNLQVCDNALCVCIALSIHNAFLARLCRIFAFFISQY